jgi:hypothetical protein
MIAVDRPGCGLTDEFRYTGTSDVRQHAWSARRPPVQAHLDRIVARH